MFVFTFCCEFTLTIKFFGVDGCEAVFAEFELFEPLPPFNIILYLNFMVLIGLLKNMLPLLKVFGELGVELLLILLLLLL